MSSLIKKFRVLIPLVIPRDLLDRLQQICEVTMLEKIDVNEFNKLVPGMDALFVIPKTIINKQLLDIAGPQLKVIAAYSAGIDHIDLDECRKRGIKVGFAAGAMVNTVAELAIGLTLAAARRFQEALQVLPNSSWSDRGKDSFWMSGKQITGSIIGIVGLGRIGFAIAKRLKSFEPSKIVYCGNGVKSYASEIDAEFVTFNELLKMSDFVIIICSLNESTKQLFNAVAFRLMKSSSILVNVSRGLVVDQDALYDALADNQIKAAGLDVTTPEPLPPDHKLLSLSNCIITPHLGCFTDETVIAMTNCTIDNIIAGLKGEPLPYPAY